MAQSGYTPILIYASGTATNVPLAANMTSSASGAELGLNYADGKLYYKNSSGVVTLLASSTTVTNSFSAGTTGLTPNTATTGAVTLAGTLVVGNGGTGQTTLATGALGYGQGTSAHASLAIGTAGQILTVNSGATAPQWTTLTGVAVTTFSAGTTGLTPSTATSGAVTLAGTLITSNGGTGLSAYTAGDLSYFASGTTLTKLAIGASGYLLTSSGTAPQWSNSINIGAGTFTSVTDSGLTSGRVPYASTGGLLTDSANMTFSGSILTVSSGVTLTANAAKYSSTYGGVTTTNLFTDSGGGVLSVDGSNTISLRTGGVSGTDRAVVSVNGLSITGTTTSSGRFIVSGSSNAGITDISYGSYSGGNWINSPSGYTGYLAIAGTGVATWNASGVDVPAGTLTVSGSGSRGVRLKGLGVGEVAITGDGSTYAVGFSFYNTTSYATQLGGLFAYTAGGAFQYLAIGPTYNSTSSIYVLANGNVGVGMGQPATKLDVNGTIRLTPNTADLNYTASIYANYNSSHPFQIDVKNNGSTFEMLGVYADGGGSNNRACFPSFPVVMGGNYNYNSGKLTVTATTNPTTSTDGNNQIYIGEASQNPNYYLNLGYIFYSGAYYGSIQSVAGGGPTALFLNAAGGNVGIGTYTPVGLVEALGSSTGKVGVTVTNSINSAGPAYIAFKGYDWVRSAIWHNRSGSGALQIAINPNTTDLTVNGCVARVTFLNNGLAIFGATAPVFSMPSTGGVSIQEGNTGGGSPIVEIGNTDTTSGSDASPALMCFKGSATTSSSARFIQFSASNASTTMGAIVGAGSGVCAFANFSDVSLKKNIQPLFGSLAKILALKPSSYDMISDDSHVNAGLIAQDVQQVYPEYVVENMSDEGKPPLMGITGGLSGGFISELICAIQELKAEFDAYKASHP